MSGRGVLLAVVELRARLLLRRLRGAGGMVELVARGVTFALAIPAALLFAVGTGAASYRALAAGRGLVVDAAVAGLLFGVWQAWTAIGLSLADREALDLRRFLVYPVSPARIWGYGVVASAAGDPFALFWSILLAGAFVGAALARPGPWLLALAAVLVLFVVATVLLMALLEELVARVARRRALRVLAIAGVYVGIGFVAFGATGGSARLFGALRVLGRVRWIFWPPALATEAVRRLYAGDVAGALPWTVALAALTALTAAAAYALALRAARGGGEGGLGATASAQGGWPLDGLPGRVGPILEKEAKYLARHPLSAVLALVVPGFAALVATRLAPAIPTDAGEVVRAVPLFGFALYAHVVTQVFWLNAFGWDRAGARLLFLAPIRPGDALVAKNAAAYGLSLILFVASAAVALAVGGAPPAWALLAAAVLHLALAPWLLAAGNLVSIVSPRPMRLTLQRGAALPATSTLAGMAAISLASGLFAAPVPLALWLDAPAALIAGWAALGALGALAYRAALPAATRLLERRREALLAVVAGDEA